MDTLTQEQTDRLTRAMNEDLKRLAEDQPSDYEDLMDSADAWLADIDVDVIVYADVDVMDRHIKRLINREYEGGWKAFVRDFRNPLESD